MDVPFTEEPLDIREAFAEIPSVVTAIAARVEGRVSVMVATSFTVGVSYDPPMVSIAVQHSSTTWTELAWAPTLGLSVLGADHAGSTRQLASRDRARRLAGIDHVETDSGAVLLAHAHTWLECDVDAVHRAGDHDIVVLRVRRLARDASQQALVWHRPARPRERHAATAVT